MTITSDIATGIVALAKEAGDKGYLDYKFKSFRSWPLDWDEELKTVGAAMPAIWATFGGWPQPERLRSGAKVRASYAVAVASSNKRGVAAAQDGGPVAGEIGVQRLMHDIIGLIDGNDLGLDIDKLELGPVTVVPTSSIMAANRIGLIVIQFTATFIYDKPALPFTPDAEFIGQFKQLVTDWQLFTNEDEPPVSTTILVPQQESQP